MRPPETRGTVVQRSFRMAGKLEGAAGQEAGVAVQGERETAVEIK